MSLRGEEMACLIPNVRVAVGKERALFLFYFILFCFFLKKGLNFVRSEISLGWTANHGCRDMEILGSYRER